MKALQIVEHKLRTLESHLENLARILNDLRSLRRLLFGERTPDVAVRRAPLSIAEKAGITPSVHSPGVTRSGVSPDSSVARPASARATIRKRAFSSWCEAHARNPRVADAVPWYVRQYIKPVGETTTRKAA